MALRVKLDEDLSASLSTILKNSGYDVATVREQGWGGMKDPVLWPKVVAEKRFFITGDREFGDIRKFPPGTHPGVLVLHPERERLSLYKAVLELVLSSTTLDKLAGCIAVADSKGIRIRRP